MLSYDKIPLTYYWNSYFKPLSDVKVKNNWTGIKCFNTFSYLEKTTIVAWNFYHFKVSIPSVDERSKQHITRDPPTRSDYEIVTENVDKFQISINRF